MPEEMIIFLIAAVVIAAIVAILHIVDANTNVSDDTINQFKEVIYKLFLYAEKEDWVGPEKMEWCIKRVTVLMPWLPMSEDVIRSLANDFYKEYKNFIIEEVETKESMG